MLRFVPVLMLAAACVEPTVENEEPEVPCYEGPPMDGVISELRFARPVSAGVSEGFDLDGFATGQGDAGGCGVEDMTSPDGTPGIDNSFSALLPALELTEAAAIEAIVQEMINSGQLLLIPRLRVPEDPSDCPTAELAVGRGVPRISAAGNILSDQTFDVDRTTVLGAVQIGDGVWEASGFTLEVPIRFLDADTTMTMYGARVRIEMDEDGSFHGLFGGGINLDEVFEIVTTTGINDNVLDAVRPLFGRVTDLTPDADGVCTEVSTTLTFRGVPAFLYE